MGFRKTPKGNIIYDFDFTPKKLVPLNPDECGYDRCYAVEGDNGQRAPISFLFSGQRALDYAIVFGFLASETQKELECDDMCVCTNIQLVASFADLERRMEESRDDKRNEYLFDPTNTRKMIEERKTFPVLDLQGAERLKATENIPCSGYSVLRNRTA